MTDAEIAEQAKLWDGGSDLIRDDDQEARIAKAAAQTSAVTKFYYYHPAERKARAREALRRISQSESFKKEDALDAAENEARSR